MAPGETRRYLAGPPGRRESESGILLLPEPERPMCIIFDEGGGNWAVEPSDGSRHSIESGHTLRVAERVADRTWRIELPAAPAHTWQPDVSEPTFNVHAPDFRRAWLVRSSRSVFY